MLLILVSNSESLCTFLQLWLTFAPVADQTAKHLHVTLDQVNWLSVVYMVVAIPLSFITTWMLDTLGLRPTVSTTTTQPLFFSSSNDRGI